MACVGDSAYSCGGAESYDLYQLIDHNIGLDSSHSGKGVRNTNVERCRRLKFKFVDTFSGEFFRICKKQMLKYFKVFRKEFSCSDWI